MIPIIFVLGFYVVIVMERWWKQYTSIPWPDSLAVYVSTLVRGNDEHGRVMRRTIMRYVNLCFVIGLRRICHAVLKRFPTYDSLVDAGLMNENEKKIFLSLDEKFPKYSKHWMPLIWASSIVTRARKEGRIWDDFSMQTIITELNKFRSNCGILMQYDSISIPLVYTQVVTIAVYTYFISALLSRQWTEKNAEEDSIDRYFIVMNFYFPIFPILEFLFFMGWLKVAESLICPFGEDDDDFEVFF